MRHLWHHSPKHFSVPSGFQQHEVCNAFAQDLEMVLLLMAFDFITREQPNMWRNSPLRTSPPCCGLQPSAMHRMLAMKSRQPRRHIDWMVTYVPVPVGSRHIYRSALHVARILVQKVAP